MTSRRQFIKTSAMSSAAMLLPKILGEGSSAQRKIEIQANDVILFQGDSITDAGRRKNEVEANNAYGLGSGYCMLAASQLLKKNPDKALRIYNKGIGGDKVYQLKDRWQIDCLTLKPTILSIHIGVNDYWHTLSSKYVGTVDTYEQDFRALLKDTLAALPNVKIIIGEPFAVIGVKAVKESWFPTFNDYRSVAKKLAEEFNAPFIPYHILFIEAQQYAPASYWTHDGVHPTLAGSQLMADAWLSVIG